jgi:hypothetical protein
MSTKQLEIAAAALGDLRERVVFLGGATIELWITDPAARAPRVTDDVDVVAEVLTLPSYVTFQGDLREAGFHEDVFSGVICRWQHIESGLRRSESWPSERPIGAALCMKALVRSARVSWPLSTRTGYLAGTHQVAEIAAG